MNIALSTCLCCAKQQERHLHGRELETGLQNRRGPERRECAANLERAGAMMRPIRSSTKRGGFCRRRLSFPNGQNGHCRYHRATDLSPTSPRRRTASPALTRGHPPGSSMKDRSAALTRAALDEKNPATRRMPVKRAEGDGLAECGTRPFLNRILNALSVASSVLLSLSSASAIAAVSSQPTRAVRSADGGSILRCAMSLQHRIDDCAAGICDVARRGMAFSLQLHLDNADACRAGR